MHDSDSARRFTVRVDEEEWRETRSLGEAAPDDNVFLVDASTGRVVFGDGMHGRRPSGDAVVTVSYREGGRRCGEHVRLDHDAVAARGQSLRRHALVRGCPHQWNRRQRRTLCRREASHVFRWTTVERRRFSGRAAVRDSAAAPSQPGAARLGRRHRHVSDCLRRRGVSIGRGRARTGARSTRT